METLKCTFEHEKHCIMFPSALLITPHCHPALLSLQSYTPLHGYNCSPQAGLGTEAKAQPYHLLHSNVGYSLNC